jgi:photosystem II stability/assembly factor-like uncharacterized protein
MPIARLLRAAVLVALAAPPLAAAQSWAPLPSGTAEVLADVHFPSPTTGFAVADGGLLLSTTDGGASWASRVLSAGLDNQGIAFNPAGTVGLIVTDAGSVFRTTDGGASWTLIPTGMGDGRAAIAWGTDDVVWVAGRDADAAVSTDGGATWAFRPSGSAERTEGMAAAGAQTAWVVGREGEIRVTTDGGVTWAPQTSGVSDDLKDIQMLDASTGYIAGSDNLVLKTTDGGATWTNVATSGVSGNGLFFLDAATGWVVGDVGDIWFTADGGASWTRQPSGTAESFNRVHFPSPERGFAVGDAGTVVRFNGVSTGAEGGPAAGLALTVGPNPARGRGVVTLTLDRPRDVTVAVYDALGREVAALHRGPLAAGAHPLALDAMGLRTGVYVVRASAEGVALAQRVTVGR